MSNKKVLLCILDGWGHAKIPEVSAIAQAKTPFVDSLYEQYPNAELCTFGEDVGLPEGQMGNSEVGHLNIGAGRVVYQELVRINKAIEDDSIQENQAFKDLLTYSKSNNKSVHLLGLLSDGGVHSHIDHIIALSQILGKHGIRVYLHMFLDGRDTSPTAGVDYLEKLMKHLPDSSVISSVIGRYFAMDRDRRWERIKKAYDLLTNGKGALTKDIIAEVKKNYGEGKTDEFMPPIKYEKADQGVIKEGDAVFFANFRTDRPRQLTSALTQSDLPEYDMLKMDLYYLTMTEYDESFQGIHVLFDKDKLSNTLGEVISRQGLKQLRIAETEKYPHVTFFFSGGREEKFENEHRILVNSPKVATYDLQPEMSAYELTDKLMAFIQEQAPDFIALNYANADMVGHTGVFEAAVKSAETLDDCLSRLIPHALQHEYVILIIADHGNSDIMINPDGTPHTSHTMNPVPIILLNPEDKNSKIESGKLADVAPTILNLMGLPVPPDMTGQNLC
jgi:2,3-bisphosphoglycerate-independent phosphoglycerate mutase